MRQRILPADVYDTLEFSALVYGGIGGGHYAERQTCGYVPLCALGQAIYADDTNAVENALIKAGVYTTDNDAAVRRVNTRRGEVRTARIPFEAWCKALNVVRGET